jgi:hypothetical protein
MLQPMEVRMILVAGADAALMRSASIEIFNAGHVPVSVESLAAPLLALSGFDRGGDRAAADEELDPLSERLLARCDAVLRVEGSSPAADAMVGCARARGLRVFFSLKEAIDG